MKAQELRGLNQGELQKKLDDLYEEIFHLRFQKTIGQLPDTNRLKAVQRDIARIKTVLRERELAVARGAI
jgi:large subunit ribosomal protein L29